MRSVLAAAVALVALLAALPAAPATRPTPAALIEKGLTRAVAAGRLTPKEAATYRADAAHARAKMRHLPPLRVQLLKAVSADVAAQWRSYTRPRALALFSTLQVNTDWLAHHALIGPHPDIAGDDGVVYRFFSSHGYVFHPLANFAKLNADATSGDVDAAGRLAAALVARGVRWGKALAWEYEFPWATGRAPWTSGMVQAVAAQALARAGDLLGDPSLVRAANAAYAAVPSLLSPRSPRKPWVALYSFDRTPVLNAQLQAAISIGDYASIVGNPAAEVMAGRLTGAAKALLPRFDTGYWSLYSLRGDESTLDYHDYVISLLRKLATRTGDAGWSNMADRFKAYESQPPELEVGPPSPVVYPRPADGFRDEATLRFWLSKRSTVTLRVGGTSVVESFGRGTNTISWAPGKAPAGLYHPRLTAVGPEGLQAHAVPPPVTVARIPGPPPVAVSISAPATLSWSSTAEGTPWLHLRVRLTGGGPPRVLDLGRRRLAGTRHLKLPPGRWHAALVATNSAGRSRFLSLGYLPR